MRMGAHQSLVDYIWDTDKKRERVVKYNKSNSWSMYSNIRNRYLNTVSRL